MTPQQSHWLSSHVDEAIEIGGEQYVLFYVNSSRGACALHGPDGRVVLASAERVMRAWLAQNRANEWRDS